MFFISSTFEKWKRKDKKKVSAENLSLIQSNAPRIKHDLSSVLKNHLRKVPELAFFIDDSLDYIDSVEDSIQNPDNPIKG